MMDMEEAKMEEPSSKADKKYGKFDEWEIESAASCLEEAEEIKADAEKMKYIKEFLGKKQKTIAATISSLADLKSVAKSKMKSDDYE